MISVMIADMSRDKKIRDVLEKYKGASSGGDYMSAAIDLARLARDEDEVPVGCVIVRGGKIIAGDYNGRENEKNALYHAEIAAIDRACAALGGWRLTGCTLYVTLEPCPMCAGAIWCAGISRVIAGAKDPAAGALGSVMNLNSYPLNRKSEVIFGLMETECRELLRSFFSEKRKKQKIDNGNT